eukprot:3799479-Rhodomonas_salina.1
MFCTGPVPSAPLPPGWTVLLRRPQNTRSKHCAFPFSGLPPPCRGAVGAVERSRTAGTGLGRGHLPVAAPSPSSSPLWSHRGCRLQTTTLCRSPSVMGPYSRPSSCHCDVPLPDSHKTQAFNSFTMATQGGKRTSLASSSHPCDGVLAMREDWTKWTL